MSHTDPRLAAAAGEPQRPERSTDSTSAVVTWSGPALIAITVVWALVIGRNLWWFSDEWNIMGTYPSGNVLEPFNGHLSLVPVALYQALFHTFGVDVYLPYRLLGLAAFALLGVTTWRYSRTFVGPTVAVVATAAILWNEGGVTNVLFPFLLNFSLPLAALPAIWGRLERSTTKDAVVASAWLIMALATSGLGLMVAVAVGIELVVQRASLKRLAIMAPGPVLWVLWYLGYGASEQRSNDIGAIASYAARMLIAGGSSLAGGVKPLGALLCVALGALVVAAGLASRLSGRSLGAIAAPVVFVVVTAMSRIGIQPEIPPDELRYRWAVGAFLVLAAISLAHDLVGASFGVVARPAVRYAALGVAALGLAVNAAQLHRDALDWADRVETAAPGLRANLWVAEQAGAAGVVNREWWMPLSFVRFTAGDYLDAVDQLGSPLAPYDADEIGGAAEQTGPANQAFIDQFGLVDALSTDALSVSPTGLDCDDAPTVSDAVTDFELPFGSTAVFTNDGVAPVELRLDLFDVPEHARTFATLDAGERAAFTLPIVTAGSALTTATIRFSGEASVASCS